MNGKVASRAISAWILYDFANSAYATTVLAAVLPVYYASVAGADLPGNRATVYWAYTVSASGAIVAILGPVLGAISDMRALRKRFLGIFLTVGVICTGLLYFVHRGDVLLASALFLVANVGFTGSLVFYDALLPHVAQAEEMDQVSSRGFAAGYVGGGLLLSINLAMISLASPEQTGLMARLCFVSVAIWWLVFSIPLLRYVHERPASTTSASTQTVRAAFTRVIETFRDVSRKRDLFLFLIAYLLYSNGINTIIHMATIYGTELGLSQSTLLGTLLMVQIAGAPFAILFGKIADRIGRKQAILLSLSIYTLIALLAQYMRTEIHFWALGFGVATVQGGSQALSRSLYGRLIPAEKSAEYFGFYSIGEKLSGIVGPALFGIVGQLTSSSRSAIASLVVFFAAGALLLVRVDEVRAASATAKEA